jgi:calcineurin-like phosphoesterase family protein
MNFFTSDTHYGHANIIKYSSRPFSSVEEMNDALVKKINDKVGVDDCLWHLGDFV